MGDERLTADDLQASHPDILTDPSKKLGEIQKRNSERGKRFCKNPECKKALAISNDGRYCFSCEEKIRRGIISRVSTRFITAGDMDLDFDTDKSQK